MPRTPKPESVVQLFSVEVGPFEEKEVADQIAAQLRGKGLTRARVNIAPAQ